jgi:uncharacterized protein
MEPSQFAERKIHWSESQKATVLAILKKRLPLACSVRILVFGSRTGDHPKAHSDLDLCFVSHWDLSYEWLEDLRDDFVESDLPFRVDLVEFKKLSELFQSKVLKEGVVIQP